MSISICARLSSLCIPVRAPLLLEGRASRSRRRGAPMHRFRRSRPNDGCDKSVQSLQCMAKGPCLQFKRQSTA
eukprot:4457651-Pleurochrysis_carterae.AAC.1